MANNRNIIIAVLIALVVICIVVLGFVIVNSGHTDNNTTVNNTTGNITNDTVNTSDASSSNSQSKNSKNSGGAWDEVQDLSEFYDDGKKHSVTIHHDGRGGIAWTDDLGHHTGHEGDIKSW